VKTEQEDPVEECLCPCPRIEDREEQSQSFQRSNSIKHKREEWWILGKLVLAKEVGASLSVGVDILKRRLLPSEPVGDGQPECGCTRSESELTVVNKN
jgi:hypothetical protein